MRNAALVLGIIGGVVGMMVGFFSYGYATLVERFSEVGEVIGFFENPAFVKAASFIGPLLAIAGGAMARARALWGGVLMIVSALGMYAAFGFNFATMFPIGMVGLAGILAIGAGKPDEPKAHF
ncbi:MAG: hypothetical protein JJ872_15100 [Marivivens sp.]|nr:hypothetical protein [Marivivens sp.]